MSYFPRLLLAVAAPVLLTNCGLINAALRLAPMAMMLVEEDGGSRAPQTCINRGKLVEERGIFGSPASPRVTRGSGLAAR